jgi:pSer/pThr/pTyr-binding forkhead associated (FHA) protein
VAANDDEGATRQTQLPQSTSPDDQATGHVADVGVIAELRAVLSNGEKKTLPLYTLADQLVVGRGSACEWQLDDASLSRKHAQLKWSGRDLTVEDLGSANGTRVGGRPARTAILVRPGDLIQLGTVTITLETRVAGNPDEQSTRLTATPESRGEAAFPQLPGLATVVKPTQARSAPYVAASPGAQQVFRPSRDLARPDEPTQEWDPRAAIFHAPDKAFDGELMARLKDAWRENRRPFVMAGAALWVGILLAVWYVHDSMVVPEEETVQMPHVPAPQVTAFNPPPLDPLVGVVPGAPDGGAPIADGERDQQLAEAIAAYDQGRLAEAQGLFRRLGAADEAAKFMVELIQQRLAGAP